MQGIVHDAAAAAAEHRGGHVGVEVAEEPRRAAEVAVQAVPGDDAERLARVLAKLQRQAWSVLRTARTARPRPGVQNRPHSGPK